MWMLSCLAPTTTHFCISQNVFFAFVSSWASDSRMPMRRNEYMFYEFLVELCSWESTPDILQVLWYFSIQIFGHEIQTWYPRMNSLLTYAYTWACGLRLLWSRHVRIKKWYHTKEPRWMHLCCMVAIVWFLVLLINNFQQSRKRPNRAKEIHHEFRRISTHSRYNVLAELYKCHGILILMSSVSTRGQFDQMAREGERVYVFLFCVVSKTFYGMALCVVGHYIKPICMHFWE